MPKKRVYELARQFDLTSAALIELLQRQGLPVRHHMNALEEDELERVRTLWQRIESGVEPLIFLCYSNKDTAFMHRLRGDLEKANLTVWTAESIKPGTPTWTRAIQDAITRCRCAVVILSKSGIDSKWVGREIHFADQRNKRMFPVLAKGGLPDPLPLELMGIQVTDARGRKYPQEVRALIRALRAYLR